VELIVQLSLPTKLQNTSFSATVPGLQLALDSTSLGAYKTCPRLYYYSIVLGYAPRQQSVHLTFGLLMHGARESYDHARASGDDHEQALRATVAWALRSTWLPALKRGWQSDSPEKNRLTLIRSIVWYLDEFENDNLETVILASGKPAVELSFQYDSGYRTIDGEPYLLCGHLDRLARFQGQPFILDLKSTKHALSQRWFDQFTPGNQFSNYVLAGQVAFHEPVVGLIVDGLQVGATFTRCMRQQVPRPQAVLEEWHEGLRHWIVRLELSAREGAKRLVEGEDPTPAWPMNDLSCDKYGGCDFRGVCSREPARRAQWLEAEYVRRVWNPLQKRGDI
jgi:hypothetical protein